MKVRTPIPAADVNALAEEMAAYRTAPGVGGWEALRDRIRKLARRHGRSWTQLLDDVHREAEAIIARRN